MNNNKAIARIVGILYIIGTISGILSVTFAGKVIGSANVLTEVSADVNEAKLGTLFILIMGISLAMVPVVIYPIVKKYDKALALGYVIFRGALETFIYIISAIWLLLVVLSKEYVNEAGFESVNHLLSSSGEQIHSFTMVIFSLGALMFYYLLYRSILIPRWLSGWGLIGATIYLVTGISAMFGTVSTLVQMPLALQEMVMAVWLIIKGFNPSTNDSKI